MVLTRNDGGNVMMRIFKQSQPDIVSSAEHQSQSYAIIIFICLMSLLILYFILVKDRR